MPSRVTQTLAPPVLPPLTPPAQPEASGAGSSGAGSSAAAGGASCAVCFSQPREILFFPCKHLVACAACAARLPQPRQCPACRASIASTLQVYQP